MRRDLFTPQQFPLSCCLRGSEMSQGKEEEDGTGPGLCCRQNTQEDFFFFFCVIANQARQCRRVQLERQEMDLGVCLCSPQQGTKSILLAVSSSQVFLLPWCVT